MITRFRACYWPLILWYQQYQLLLSQYNAGIEETVARLVTVVEEAGKSWGGSSLS